MNQPSRKFLQAFQARRECCRAMLELSRLQETLIHSDRYEELNGVLSQKQALLDHFQQLALDQKELFSSWKSQRVTLPIAERTACEAVFDETEQLLATLMHIEQECTHQLQNHQQQTQLELQMLTSGGSAHSAYQADVPERVVRLDLKS